jgi:hypothetical protein
MALISCTECKGEISDKAAACPRCGAPVAKVAARPEPRRAGIGTALIGLGGLALIAMLFGIAEGGSGTGSSIADSLRAKQAQCRTNVEELQRLGVKADRRAGSTSAEYDETTWARFEHDDKVRQALLWYCADMPDGGSYSVYIRGLHNGKILASVNNGNYFDN